MEESNTLPKKEAPTPFISKVLKWAGYPLAAISGYLVARNSVREDAYDTAKRFGVFDDILKEYKPINETNVKARLAGEITQEEFLARSAMTKTGYSKAASERLEHMGIGEFPEMWNYIRRGSKQRAVIEGMTVAGIAIGAWLTIANSKPFASLFAKDDEQHER
jgi:hypothetical protein